MSRSSLQSQTLNTVSPELRSALTGLNRDGASRLSPALILSLPLLGSLSGEQAAWLAQRVAIRRLRRNEVLVHQGEPDRAFHIVCSGSVHAVRQGRNGRSLLLDVLGPGGHFGERGLIDEQPRETTVRCAKASELLTVQGADFRQCLAESHALRSALMRTLSQRLRERNQRIAMLALNDVHGCVVRHLQDASVEVQGQRIVHPPFTRQFVADRIGASREMVSRVFKDLTASGKIQHRQDGSLLLHCIATV